MLVLGAAALEATKTHSKRGDFATVLTAQGRVSGDDSVDSSGKTKKGRKGKRVSVRVTSPTARRFGLVHRTMRMAGVSGRAEMRRRARRELVRSSKPVRGISLSHPGIPSVQRGDSCMVVMPEAGTRALLFVRAVSHSVTPGDYTMELEFRWRDPYVHKSQRCARRAKAKARGRRADGPQCEKPATPKRGKRRQDAQRTRR